MPGTILVSVLEFMDLPSSSPSSSKSIKVSMGKREYQAWDKGDFSFPLTTLRDNLVVLLQDDEGNEISHAGIETKSIVEKGLWDDFFPLKGGGYVHMKLQFVLSEEERNRIRVMRESALKKKHGGFTNSLPSRVQTPSARINAATDLCLYNEVSDRNEETSSGITMQQRDDFTLANLSDRKLVEKIEALSLPANVPSGAICADESERLLTSSQSGVGVTNLPNLHEYIPHNLEKQSLPKKTPSNVKKMISAFESGLAEDMKSHIKPPPTIVQSDKFKTGAPLKNVHLKEDKKVNTETAQLISKGVVNSFPSGDLQLDPICGESSGEQINLLGALDGTIPSNGTRIKNEFKLLHQEVDIKDDNSLKDFIKTSTSETVEVSERRSLGKHNHQPCDMLKGKQDSGGNPVIEESRLELSSKNSQNIDIQGASAHACTSVAKGEDRHNPFESSGAWIFPDEAIHICITTSGKKVMNLLGGCSMKPNIHQGGMNFSLPENIEEHNVDIGTGVEVTSNELNQRPRKLKVENSENAETSRGPVRQAIKVAIMVGFGTLVLLTRQRKNW